MPNMFSGSLRLKQGQSVMSHHQHTVEQWSIHASDYDHISWTNTCSSVTWSRLLCVRVVSAPVSVYNIFHFALSLSTIVAKCQLGSYLCTNYSIWVYAGGRLGWLHMLLLFAILILVLISREKITTAFMGLSFECETKLWIQHYLFNLNRLYLYGLDNKLLQNKTKCSMEKQFVLFSV